MMIQIGTKLRQLRDEKRFSQELVAEKLGISQANYSRLESDKMQPNSELLPKIADLYGIAIKDLFTSEAQQYVNISQYHDQAFSSYWVHQESQKFVEKLLEAKDEIIAIQRNQIAVLEEEIKRLQAAQKS